MKELTTILVRIAGLVLIVFTVSKLPAHAMAYTVRPQSGILSYLLPLIIPILVGILLFTLSSTVSRTILSSASDTIKLEKAREILYIGCVLIGIVVFFFSLSDLVFHLSTAVLLHQSPDYELSLATYDYPSAIATVIELLFSMMLIFRTTLLLNFVYKYSKQI